MNGTKRSTLAASLVCIRAPGRDRNRRRGDDQGHRGQRHAPRRRGSGQARREGRKRQALRRRWQRRAPRRSRERPPRRRPRRRRLTCGAGRDTVRGDAQDKAGADCEVVRGIPPKDSSPPPLLRLRHLHPHRRSHRSRLARIRGQTQNGNFVFLTVSADRTFTGLRVNDLPAECDGGGSSRRRRGLRRQQVPDHGRRHVRRRRNLGRLDRPGRRRVHALGRPSRWTLRHGNVRERDDRHELRTALPGHGAPLFVRRDQMDGNAPLMS